MIIEQAFDTRTEVSMALSAYAESRPGERRPSPPRRGRARLQLVEPLDTADVLEEFGEAVFDEIAAPSEWSVWQRPMPEIPRREILTRDHAAVVVPEFRPRGLVRGAPPLVDSGGRAAARRDDGMPSPSTRRRRAPRYRMRRLVAALLVSAVVGGVVAGADVLAQSHQGAPVALDHSVSVAGGQLYTVQPGDTLWSIASAVYPNGDPRALVATLETRLGSAAPVPGERILLP